MTAQGSLAGTRAGRTVQGHREIFQSEKNIVYGRGVIDATYAYDGANTGYVYQLRAGTIMARITASKLWVPCKRTVVTVGTGSVTTCTVTDARAFKIGDTILIGADAVTLTNVNYSTNVLTWVGAVTIAVADIVIGTGGLAGSEIARGILADFVDLLDHDTATATNKATGKIALAGLINVNMVLGDLTAIKAATNYLDGFLWSDEQGQS